MKWNSIFDSSWLYTVLAVIGGIGGVVFCIIEILPWWSYVIIPPIVALLLPFALIYSVLMPIGLVLAIILGIGNIKKYWKEALVISAAVIFIIMIFIYKNNSHQHYNNDFIEEYDEDLRFGRTGH